MLISYRSTWGWRNAMNLILNSPCTIWIMNVKLAPALSPSQLGFICCHTPLLRRARIYLVIPFEVQWFKANLLLLCEFLFSTVTNISLAFICIRASNCAIFSICILLVIYHLASRGPHYAKDKGKTSNFFLELNLLDIVPYKDGNKDRIIFYHLYRS